MTVEAILKSKGRNVFTIRPEHSVADTCALLSAKKVGVAVVCDAKGLVVGMISERDIVAGIAQYGKGLLEMPVRNVMSSPVVNCSPDEPVKKVMRTMNERRFRHLPVIDKGELVGIVSIGDAVNHRLDEAQLEMSVLRDFAATR